MLPESNIRKAIIITATVFLLAVLLPFLLLGFYNVPLADDFVFAYKIQQEVFWGSQAGTEIFIAKWN